MQVFVLHKGDGMTWDVLLTQSWSGKTMLTQVPKVNWYFESNKIPGNCCVEGAQCNLFSPPK